ncbi:MAG: polymer-forming cytoskeletal protein [Alphaproteobacteria bacterium]|nr:MAG: polymer-forming cytoskeletal protein [Alphaproteobacteria bacterium]
MAVEKRTIRSDIPGSDTYEQSVARSEGKRLIVGEGISLSGEIGACEHLVVEGYVQAALRDGKRMDIMPSGHVKGEITVEDAEISGHFEGVLNVRGRLVIRGSATVIGTVEYGSLRVEPGAAIVGTMTVQQVEAEAPALNENQDNLIPRKVTTLFEGKNADAGEDCRVQQVMAG